MNLFQEMEVNYKDFIESANDFIDSCREYTNKSDTSKEQSSMNYYNLYKELVDKIKAKIEEVQNMKAKAKDIVFKSSLNYIETELKSLLEKE